MILIADSGSTKTDWRLIDDKKNISQYATIGFSPTFQDSFVISAELKKSLIPSMQHGLSSLPIEIYYYGTGCSNVEKRKVISDALKDNFPNAVIEVNHDLLAAARALCGRREGIVGILGTGSNSCYYDGSKIVENVYSLGFILGDEGSGAHIGKTFIKAYLEQELPVGIAERFQERFKINRDDVIEAVYKKPMPQRFLASFSHFIFQNLKEQYISDMAANCFRGFFDKQICKYPKHKELKLSCTGSVAFYYSNLLRAVASEKGVEIDRIVESPIAALALYHTGE